MTEEIGRLPLPHESAAFDPEEFAYVFNIAMHASIRKTSARKPSDNSLKIQEHGGGGVEVRPADIPPNRVAMAVAEHYRGESEKYMSMMWRIFALMEIAHDECLDS